MRSSAHPQRIGPMLAVATISLTFAAAAYSQSPEGVASEPAPASEAAPALRADSFSLESAGFNAIWRDALQAILARTPDQAESAFGKLLEMDVSAFRVALLADDAVRRGGLGGGVLLLEQDARLDKLGPNGKQIAELLDSGREQMNQADDGFYFAAIGRFDVAAANFSALADGGPDPVAVLEFTDSKPNRKRILHQVLHNPICGEAARRVVTLLEQGEVGLRADPRRIRSNIARLAGPPRGFENATAALKESGEFAVPFLIETLQDPDQRELVRPILRALPQLDRPAVAPLCAALSMAEGPTKLYVVDALGNIGYRQAVPYLLKLRDAESTSVEVRSATERALNQIYAKERGAGGGSAAEEFYALAEQYYDRNTSLTADPRVNQASIWVWNDGFVQNISVPTSIHEDVMAMRCCAEALRLKPDHTGALSLWLAANLRRAADLPEGAADATRPEPDPSPVYYAQSAGVEPCLQALQRALKNKESAVALGCIEALRNTAGPAALTGKGTGVGPLAEALAFPEQVVRIRAALCLGQVRLNEPFTGRQNLVPALSEALQVGGVQRGALVVDADDAGANATAASLRESGFKVVSDAGLLAGLEKVRKELPGLDVVALAADMSNPALVQGLSELRREYRFANTPVLIVPREGTESAVRRLQDQDPRVGLFPAGADSAKLQEVIGKVAKKHGSQSWTAEDTAKIAIEAAQMLRALGSADGRMYDLGPAENALEGALKGGEGAELRIAAAQALAWVSTASAQEALASAAFASDAEEVVRVAAFDALAEAGRGIGSKLSKQTVEKLVEAVSSDSNLSIREAASRALGALNVGGNAASKIIRDQHRGS